MIKEKFNKIKELIVKNKKKTIMYSLVFLAVVSTITTSTLLILNNNKVVNSLNNSSADISSNSSNIETSSKENISSSEISSSEISSNAESQNNSSNYPGNSSANQAQNNNANSSKVSNTQNQNKPIINNNTNKPQNNNATSSKNNSVQNQAPTNQRTWQYMESLSRETFNLMNQFRQQHGVAPLKWNETCNARAKKQAKYNAETNTFGHGSLQISLGNDVGTAQSFINQWANSEGHKNNMLDIGSSPKTDGAVAVYKDSTGAYFVVASFTNDFWG